MSRKSAAKSVVDSFYDDTIKHMKAIRPRTGEFGSVEICRSNKEILSKVRYMLSTGIAAWDEMLGGGFPFGRITEVYGLDGCGKTAMALRSAVRAQTRQIYERVHDSDVSVPVLRKVEDDGRPTFILYVDNEGSLENDEKIVIEGVAIDCILARCDTVDQLFKEVDKFIERVTAWKDKNKIEPYVVVIIDTIAGTSSKEEMKAEWGKDDYPRQPKQLRQAFRMMMRKINRNNVCMICTNQVSDSYAARQQSKSNLPQDQDFSTFGGRALKFYASLRIFMFKIPGTVYKLVPKAQFAAGFLVGFYTAKNRIVKPCRSGRVVIVFDRGFDDLYSKLETLVFLKFAEIQKGGSGRISFKFKKNGIETTTFGAAKTTDENFEDATEEEDDDAGGRHNPNISCKAEWPAFYAAHASDFDLMWSQAIKYSFATEGADGVIAPDAAGSEDEDEDDQPAPRRAARTTTIED